MEAQDDLSDSPHTFIICCMHILLYVIRKDTDFFLFLTKVDKNHHPGEIEVLAKSKKKKERGALLNHLKFNV